MKKHHTSLAMIALWGVVALTGCNDSGQTIMVPNKPPLSAEQAKLNAEKAQKARIKNMELNAKQKRK